MKFLYEIFRFIRYDNKFDNERIIIAYIHFETQFRINLISPHAVIKIQEFIEQLKVKKHV